MTLTTSMKRGVVPAHPCADAAAGVLLSFCKSEEPAHKKFKTMMTDKKDNTVPGMTPFLSEPPKAPLKVVVAPEPKSTPSKKAVKGTKVQVPASSSCPPNTAEIEATSSKEDDTDVCNKKRQFRLEQNRRAAKVSRERKKSMVDEIQRSISMISDANSKLKSQNAELDRLMALAQAQVDSIEGKTSNVAAQPSHTSSNGPCHPAPTTSNAAVQSSAPAVAVAPTPAQIINNIPAAAAVAAAAALPALVPPTSVQQQPGLTLQAMMDFQKAAANAMQAAMLAQAMNQQMQQQPPVAPSVQQQLLSMALNPQQAYMDHLTAFALQQSLANAAMTVPTLNSNPVTQSNVLAELPLRMGQFFLWQQQQQHMQQQQQQRQNS